MEIVGWVGALLLAVCAAPQTLKCIQQGHGRGLSHIFLWVWFWGELLTLTYMVPKLIWPAILNLSINLLFLCVILYYRYFPRNTDV